MSTARDTQATAAIYCRISSDPTGEAAGVERQRQDCEQLAATLGLTVVEVLTDNDVSAFSGVTRPAFERLLEGGRNGAYGHIIAWHPDRLYRRLVDLVRITEDLRGVEIHTCQAGDVDLTTPAGRLMANTLGGIGQYESEHKAERIARRARQRAEGGTMTASQRPRGWAWADPCPGGESCRHRSTCTPGQRARIGSRSGLVLHPDEAPIVAAAYRDIADGLSLTATWKRAVAAGLDMTTSTGLRGVLLNPRNAGLVTHKGVVVAQAADGLAIVGRDLFDRVGAVLSDPTRRTSPGRPAGTPLGGGLAVCPRCDGPLAAGRKGAGHGSEDRVSTYVCSRHMHFSVRRHRLDGPTLDLVGRLLAEMGAAGDLLIAGDDSGEIGKLRADIGGTEQRLSDLAALVSSGELDPADYAMAARGLRAKLDTLTATLTRRSGRPALVALAADPEGVTAAYARLRAEAEAGDVEPLRALLREVVRHVRPQRDGTIIIDWKAAPGPVPTTIPAPQTARRDRDGRQAKVAELYGQGMNVGQIAEGVPCNRSTVRKDLAALGLRAIPTRKARAA